ncbi:hypothetical protein D9M71_613050 [compost metagenome]
MLDLVGGHLVLQFAVGEKLHATGIDCIVVDGALINASLGLIEKALRADIPVADGCQQRDDCTVQGNVSDLFTEHLSLYR